MSDCGKCPDCGRPMEVEKLIVCPECTVPLKKGEPTYGALEEERDKLRAEVLDLRRVLGPHSTVEIALKAHEHMVLQIGEAKDALETIVHTSTDLSITSIARRGLNHITNDSRHTIDYRQLLSKYLDHVGDCEGVTFIHAIGGSKVAFSDEEIAELRTIEKETKK